MTNFDAPITQGNTITVIVGVDGSVPPNDLLTDLRESVAMQVNREADYNINRDTVQLTTQERPTDEQMQILGGRTLHIQTYDITLDEQIDQAIVNAAHNTVVDKVSQLGFEISGTATVWDGNIQQ